MENLLYVQGSNLLSHKKTTYIHWNVRRFYPTMLFQRPAQQTYRKLLWSLV